MIAVKYVRSSLHGDETVGCLIWTHSGPEGTPQAQGGVAPPTNAGDYSNPRTVVLVVFEGDHRGRVLTGWVHPDDIEEISGEDHPLVQCQIGWIDE